MNLKNTIIMIVDKHATKNKPLNSDRIAGLTDTLKNPTYYTTESIGRELRRLYHQNLVRKIYILDRVYYY